MKYLQYMLGNDQIRLKENKMLIFSPVDMEDWMVSEYRKTEVTFQGRPYCLVGKEKIADNKYCYKLVMWTNELKDYPGKRINYDLDYVQDRDETIRINRFSGIYRIIIIPLLPFLGFLWSGLKLKLHDKVGIHPLSITFYSIFFEFILGLNIMVFFSIMLFSGMSFVFILPPFAVLFLVDAAMRFGRAFNGNLLQYGFYEWFFSMIMRNK